MLIRRRYYFWLFKAYIRRWNKVIFTSLLLGIVGFFIAIGIINFYIQPLLDKKVEKIGYVGVYTAQNLPESILMDISYGFTEVNPDGSIIPAAASKWEVRNNGKEYVFYLKPNQYFHNGEELTADTAHYNFENVRVKKIDQYTIAYELDDAYAPFLSSVARPLLTQDFKGLGEYEITDVTLNAGFIKSLTFEHMKDSKRKKIISFYPTQESLKLAFMLGEIDIAKDLHDLVAKDTDLSMWKNVSVEKEVNYSKLLTLFYNTQDESLSNKKLRQALNYATPSDFAYGERTFSSIPENSIYFQEPLNYGITDKEIAKTLLDSKDIVLEKPLVISTTEEYEHVAKEISDAWGEVGVKTTIELVREIPSSFQILLYPFNMKNDPDQYALWHSQQANNISRYKNLRIDKLLEDGRSTVDMERRKTIYADFQKYLLDDQPATFLYYPHSYTLRRD